jgi:hypothetical protein
VDEVGGECGPSLEAVEDAGIGTSVLERLYEQFGDRARTAGAHALDDLLKTWIGAKPIAEGAFAVEGGPAVHFQAEARWRRLASSEVDDTGWPNVLIAYSSRWTGS